MSSCVELVFSTKALYNIFFIVFKIQGLAVYQYIS